MELPNLCALLLATLVLTLHVDLGLAQSSTPRSVVTQAIFDGLTAAVPASCEAKGFYTYDGFITAAESFSAFGTTGSDVTRKQELAAFLANVMHETGALCFVRETNPTMDYCDPSYTQWPCAANQRYIGRGPLQLSWNYNYGAAGQALQFDGLNNPDIVAQDPTISFKTAVWFWMSNSNCHNAIVSGQGFGGTIRAINSGECNGGSPAQVNSRVNYYNNFCSQFGVDPGSNISC